MYSVRKVQITEGSGLYDYCAAMTKAANNLYNAALFRIRQVFTATNKDESKWTANEREVMEEIRTSLPVMGSKYSMPTKGKNSLSYGFIEALFRATNNPDYFCKDISRQSTQQVIKEVVRAMNSFYELRKAYAANPKAFKEKPGLPKYRRKGGFHTVTITNQDSYLKKSGDAVIAKLPKTNLTCSLGKMERAPHLKQATITLFHNTFTLAFTADDFPAPDTTQSTSKRVCSIDFGVNNLAAITNNAGLSCLLFKGGIIKSVNQRYNKEMSRIRSEQTKGTTKKFQPTPESDALCVRRDNQISDLMHKTGKAIVQWCVDNDIDTIVMGHNAGWKQEVNMGHVNNQNFVQIPFYKLQSIIQYLAERAGIQVVMQEESYTSKASFPDGDAMPVYSESDANKNVFSGKRKCRGLYRTKNGTEINADLNASANIGRKAFPELFKTADTVDFNSVVIFKHPDYYRILENRKAQKAKAADKANQTAKAA